MEGLHEEALARYEQKRHRAGVAFAAIEETQASIELGVLSSADAHLWGHDAVSIDDRIDTTAWVYSPLTATADVAAMTFFAVVHAPRYLMQAVYIISGGG